MPLSDHALGVRLREILIRDWYEGVPPEPQRLRSLAEDLCCEDPRLLPPLTHLVLSPCFRANLAQDPPLDDDGVTAALLRQELRAIFSLSLCARMERVLQGLLAVSERNGARSESSAGQTLAAMRRAGEATELPVTVWARAPHARVIALGSLLGGSVLLGLAGLAFWVFDSRALRLSGQPSLLPPGGLMGQSPELLPAGLGTSERGSDGLGGASGGGATEAQLRREARESASRTVETIYASLARGETALARSLMAGPALKDFRPASSSRCHRVEVADLQELGQNDSSVDLDGVVTCRYADGSLQKEARRFRVDIALQPPRLIEARFEGIVRPRGPASAEPGLATR